MSYPASAALLKQLFFDHNYEERRKRQNLHSATVTVATLSNGSSIQIVFPGYKPNATDYRVELRWSGNTGDTVLKSKEVSKFFY
ncbi:hypothetical protein, partial [Hymenobacter frigidus]|uniref:hypothetical protein n=1 Tax=Hymenobacter frigidus TaxID=1524095 RepID=UPI001E3DD002